MCLLVVYVASVLYVRRPAPYFVTAWLENVLQGEVCAGVSKNLYTTVAPEPNIFSEQMPWAARQVN